MAGEENVESAKTAYAAFSAGDAAGAMENIADDVEWVTAGHASISGTVHGKQEVGALWARFAVRVALLPVIAGVSYEIIRFAAKHRGSLFALMTAPGLWLQRITTQPPSDEMAQCAITALDQAMALEKDHGGELVIA